MYTVQALRTAGARCVYVLATHGVFSAEALAIISSLDSNFVKSVHVTNSIPQTISKAILKGRLGIIDASGIPNYRYSILSYNFARPLVEFIMPILFSFNCGSN